jgi:filamentous hemagglutinin
MIGKGGTRVTSRTLLQTERFRIDVENPAPGVRPGQLHFQDDAGNKYLYDFEDDTFRDLPRSLADKIAADPAVQRAVATGKRYLGLHGGS